MNETITRFLVCPYTRKEIVVTPINHKVFCPECKMYHLLPDGVSRSTEKLKEMNMCEESWQIGGKMHCLECLYTNKVRGEDKR